VPRQIAFALRIMSGLLAIVCPMLLARTDNVIFAETPDCDSSW
jgi:hypothetical protein